MAVGAIGSVTTTSYNPYVYNTNRVSAASLNKIKSIPDDATKGGLDFTSLSNDKVDNINPLRPGESKNFADILMSQMSSGAYRQSQLLATNPLDE